MASFTSHDGSEPVTSSNSQDAGNTAQESEGSAPATPQMSAENNGSSELGVGQAMAVSRKELPSIIPGGAPIFVNERQYDAILRLRERRARVKARRERDMLKVKDHRPRGYRGRFIAFKDNQEGTSGGRQAPSSIPASDLCWRFVATNDDEENVGEVAYDSILNLEAPDSTALLRIMMSDRYDAEVSGQFENVARLDAPGFATILTLMNNIGYDEATDDGYYDVDKVTLKIAGW